MESSRSRVLQSQECGTLLIERSRAPYLTGCVLPAGEVLARLEARVGFYQGQAALALNVRFGDGRHDLQYVLPYHMHRAFLLSLTEAPALYVLPGREHPVAMPDGTGVQTLAQRLYQGGIAAEVTEAVRAQVLLLERFGVDEAVTCELQPLP